MIDNTDGTVTYSEKEIKEINIFLKKLFDRITEFQKQPRGYNNVR